MPSVDDLKKKYVDRIKTGLGEEHVQLSSRQYREFKEQYMPKHMSLYEKVCNLSERVLSLKPDPATSEKLTEALRVSHVSTTPSGVYAFSILFPLVLIILVSLLCFIGPILIASALGAEAPAAYGSLFVLLFGVIVGLGIIIPLQKFPFYLANNWRMRASNQMVLCVFYVVTYMRHTSNLELAIDFAGEHLGPPLSLDMKKILWDIETDKYDSMKESLDIYLETWKEWNPEFIESMHLIEGSLLEGSEARRLEMLDKSLHVMLEETYEKMLHYAHNLKSPLTALHMLGVILPILGLVILPLMVNFIEGVKWFHMAIVYNLALPGLVYVLAKSILSTRPTGYGNTDITEVNPALKRYKTFNLTIRGKDIVRVSPAVLSSIILFGMLLVAFFPLEYHYANQEYDWVFIDGALLETRVDSDLYKEAAFFFLDYRPKNPSDPLSDRTNGPYGIGAILMSLLIPLGLGVSIGIYYFSRARNVIKIRDETKELEQEFASALFQLGNRLGDGIPAEIAFAKVADVLEDTKTGEFFDIVTTNITKLGMSVDDALFDRERGAILFYPSSIIESSMKVLSESSKKGPLIASQALINVSEYIKQMHRVDERLKDLMSDVISSMKSQIAFLTPVIAGIVIGITSMIASLLGKISAKLTELGGSTGDLSAAGGAGAIFEVFGAGGIPTFHFQAIVGIYVVQITYILTIMVNGIENGADSLAEESQLGVNLLRSPALYVIISAVTIVMFGFIAGNLVRI
ncbi:MAG: hypothetical protein OXR66_05405 [Candidatus Woesearchaeota archaeon]|nr:hypothetical protein [Candidatus Woesearchaeota archaeon]